MSRWFTKTAYILHRFTSISAHIELSMICSLLPALFPSSALLTRECPPLFHSFLYGALDWLLPFAPACASHAHPNLSIERCSAFIHLCLLFYPPPSLSLFLSFFSARFHFWLRGAGVCALFSLARVRPILPFSPLYSPSRARGLNIFGF